MEKNGVLEFIARMAGFDSVADLREKGFIPATVKDETGKRKLTGEVKLAATYSVEGREVIKGNVKRLTKDEWLLAVDSGAVRVLAQALGHVDAKGAPRLTVLERVRGIAPEKKEKAPAKDKASSKMTPVVTMTPEEKRALRERDLVTDVGQ